MCVSRSQLDTHHCVCRFLKSDGFVCKIGTGQCPDWLGIASKIGGARFTCAQETSPDFLCPAGTDTSGSQTAISDWAPTTLNGQTSVVPNCKESTRTVAYILPKLDHSAGPVTHRIIYTNSKALPLLIPLRCKAGRGVWHRRSVRLEVILTGDDPVLQSVRYTNNKISIHLNVAIAVPQPQSSHVQQDQCPSLEAFMYVYCP